MDKRLLSLLVLLCLVFGTLFALEKRRNSELTATIDSARKDVAALTEQAARDRAEILELKNQIDVYRMESEALRRKLASGDSASGPTSDAGESSAQAESAETPGKGSNFLKGIAKMLSDPKMKKAMQAQQAMGIRMIYGDFFKEHPLDPETAQKVSDILAERQMETSAAGIAAMQGGAVDPASAEKLKETRDRYDDLLKATLGDENYQSFKEYEGSIGERFLLQQYDGQFATAGVPLEGDQRATLLSIMREEREKAPASPLGNNNADPQSQMAAFSDPAAVDNYVKQQTEINQRVLDRARNTLSPDQVVALERAQANMLEMMRGQMSMSKEMFGK